MSIILNGSKGINQNTTEVTKIPVGTTAQRPANPVAGMIRFNTDLGYVEWYDDVVDIWAPINTVPGVVASGGTVTNITQNGIQYAVHTFTSSGTFEVSRGGDVDVFIVGGGGAGLSGGGGGGRTLTQSIFTNAGSFPIVVGAGGSAFVNVNPANITANSGESSSAFGLAALGGNGAFNSDENNIREGGAGGSGGGASSSTNNQPGNGGSDGSDGGSAQRGNGGSGQNTTTREFGEIGGTLYAGGGGGGVFLGASPGVGGAGGGGDGALGASEVGSNGVNGLGGGGGGGGSVEPNQCNPGSGGSGIVIVRYRIG